MNIGEVKKSPLNKKIKFSSIEQEIGNIDEKVDLIVQLLNGIGEEDGSVQGILETLNIL